MTNHPPSVLWHCWLDHQTCKNRRPYNLYCVGADVKPCSINWDEDIVIKSAWLSSSVTSWLMSTWQLDELRWRQPPQLECRQSNNLFAT